MDFLPFVVWLKQVIETRHSGCANVHSEIGTTGLNTSRSYAESVFVFEDPTLGDVVFPGYDHRRLPPRFDFLNLDNKLAAPLVINDPRAEQLTQRPV